MLVYDGKKIYEICHAEISEFYYTEKKMFTSRLVQTDEYKLKLYSTKTGNEIILVPNDQSGQLHYTLTLEEAREALEKLFQDGKLDLTEFGLKIFM